MMVGPSTPMFPQGWQDSRLTVLAGSWWDNEHKEEIFKLISLAGEFVSCSHICGKQWQFKLGFCQIRVVLPLPVLYLMEWCCL